MGKVIEHNAATGEIVERDQTSDEIAQAVKDAADLAASAQVKQDKIAARDAVLLKLGITQNEAKILLS